MRENSQQFVISDASCSNRMSSPRKETKKENKEHDKDDEENPTNADPGITESYDD